MRDLIPAAASWLRGTWALLAKEVRVEVRSRHALNTLTIFVLTTLFLVALAAGQVPITPRLQAGLIWMVILFSAALGLGRTFLAEEEQGTALLLRLHVPSSRVYAGKLCYNLVLSFVVNGGLVVVFIVLLRVRVGAPLLLLLSLVLGTIGLAGTTTILAALVAQSQRRAAPLLPTLMFPLLIPLLLPAINATHSGLIGSWEDAGSSLLTLASFSGSIITASAMLFGYAWRD